MHQKIKKSVLEPGSRIMLHECRYDVVHVGTSKLRLHSCDGGGHQWFSTRKILSLLESEELKVISCPTSVGPNLDAEALKENPTYKKIQRKFRYVQILNDIFGGPVWHDKSLPHAIQKASLQLGDSSVPGASTVMGWRKFLRQHDNDPVAAWIVSTRSSINKSPKSGRLQRRRELVERLVDEMLRSQVPITARALKSRYLEAISQPALANSNSVYRGRTAHLPNTRTFSRYIAQFADPLIVQASKIGMPAAKRAFTAAGRSMEGYGFMDVAMADGQLIDCVVVDSLMRVIGRPYLTVILELQTTCVLGYVVTLAPFCADTAMQAWRMAVTPGPNTDSPRGVPRRLVVDNGADYISASFRSAVAQTFSDVISAYDSPEDADSYAITQLAPKYPNGKAELERLFVEVSRALSELPGKTSSNPQVRDGYDSEKGAAFTIEQLEYAIAGILDQRERDTYGRTRIAPRTKWNEAVETKRPRTIAPELARSYWAIRVIRTVTNGRVKFEHHAWKSSFLANYEQAHRAAGRKPIVTLLVDPTDLSSASVSLPHDSAMVVPVDSTTPLYSAGLTLFEHRQIRTRKSRLLRTDFAKAQDEELLTERNEFRQELIATAVANKRARRSRERILKANNKKQKKPTQVHPILPATPESSSKTRTAFPSDQTVRLRLADDMTSDRVDHLRKGFQYRRGIQ